MIARKSGHIVALASVMSFESTARAICYSTTKFGIRGLMEGLYDLFRIDNLNINVTTVHPALVNTRKEFIDQFIAHDGYHVILIHLNTCFRKSNLFSSLNYASELVFYTPEEVACATVDGILKNKKYVSMPPFSKQIFSFLK